MFTGIEFATRYLEQDHIPRQNDNKYSKILTEKKINIYNRIIYIEIETEKKINIYNIHIEIETEKENIYL